MATRIPPADGRLLKIRVELGGRVYEEDLEPQAFINPDLDGLNRALAEHPGRFAWWAMLETYARASYEGLSTQLETLDATLFSRYQRQLLEGAVDGKKGPTLDSIRSLVTLDRERQALVERTARAKQDFEQVTVGRRTMEQRKDALLAIASNLRAEMDARLAVGKSRLEEMYQGRQPVVGGPGVGKLGSSRRGSR